MFRQTAFGNGLEIPSIGLVVSRKHQKNLVSVLGDEEKAMNGKSILV